jgi:hypothetical protein
MPQICGILLHCPPSPSCGQVTQKRGSWHFKASDNISHIGIVEDWGTGSLASDSKVLLNLLVGIKTAGIKSDARVSREEDLASPTKF